MAIRIRRPVRWLVGASVASLLLLVMSAFLSAVDAGLWVPVTPAAATAAPWLVLAVGWLIEHGERTLPGWLTYVAAVLLWAPAAAGGIAALGVVYLTVRELAALAFGL